MIARLRRLGRKLPASVRHALKRVVSSNPKIPSRPPVQSDFVATDGFVHDSGVLHMCVELSQDVPECTSEARLLLSSEGTVRHSVPVLFRGGAATVALRLPTGLRRPGDLVPMIDRGTGPQKIRFGIRQPAPSMMIRNPYSRSDGIRYLPLADRRQALHFKVRRLRTAHVNTVDAVFGVIEVGVIAILGRDEPPAAILIRRRGTESVHRISCVESQGVPLEGGRDARWEIRWRVPTSVLARSVSGEPSGVVTWDLFLEVGKHAVPLGHELGDIKDPRPVFRYRTVTDVDASREAFRPYWTLHGTLALEHFHGVRA